VAAAILVAGGAAIASNTGFKINKGIVLIPAGPTTAVGDNWLSLPYFNPYVTVGGFCTQVGLASTGGVTVAKAQVTTIDAVTGVASSVQCGSAAASTTNLVAGRAYRVRQPANNPANLIIVGSHNPTQQIDLFNGLPYPPVQASPKGDNWVGIPYHTTAATYNDLCLSSGLSSTGGVTVAKARILRLDATTGNPTSALCGSAAAATQPLNLGEGIQIREPNTPKSFIPAHF
jgi:hypothetical protein